MIDLNGDAILDIVTANTESNSLSVLLNTGTGSLASPMHLNGGVAPVAIAAIDYDMDGDMDVLVANKINTGTISVMTNPGSGALVKTGTIPIGRQPKALAIGRFNNDVAPDVAVIHENNDYPHNGLVALLYNNGNGTFDFPLVAFESNGKLAQAIVSDLNLDQADDIVILASDTPAYRMMNDGFGGFRAMGMPSLYGAFVSGACADVNNDGRPDLIACQPGSTVQPQVSIFPTSQDGSFGEPLKRFVVHDVHGVFPSDVDGDGAIDILVARFGGFTYLSNRGTESFEGYRLLQADVYPSNLHVIDVDDDGDLDVFAGRGFGNRIAVFKNIGALSFDAPTTYSFGASSTVTHTELADVDGDGDLDAVIQATDNRIHILFNNGSFEFSSPIAFVSGSGSGEHVAADLDNDGDVDIAAPSPGQHSAQHKLNLFMNDGSANFIQSSIVELVSRPFAVVAADFDGDNLTDLAVTSGRTSGTPALSILRNIGGGEFVVHAVFTFVGRPGSPEPADLNKDGWMDIVVPLPTRLTGGVTNTVATLMNNGAGQLTNLTYYPTGGGAKSARVVDVNGDTRPDILLRAAFEGIVVLLQQVDGSFEHVKHDTLDEVFDVAVDDFNQDGMPDVVLGQSGALTLLLHQGIPIEFMSHPQSVEVAIGEAVTIRATIQDSAEATLQWFKNGHILTDDDRISGSDTLNLSISPVTAADHALYFVRATRRACSIDSQAASVVVQGACHLDVAPNGGDGVVGHADLALVLNLWGTTDSVGDVNGSGLVDLEDLLAVIRGWGYCFKP